MKVLIMGRGIVAHAAALHLRNALPHAAEIVVVGPPTRAGAPVVGESTIVLTAQFLENRLGLGDYLRQHHYPKYALTYYLKLAPDDPGDRRYAIQCEERDPVDQEPLPGWTGPMARPPSWTLNREVFDRDLRRMVDEQDGLVTVDGWVTDVELDAGDRHRVTVRPVEGDPMVLEADWVLDATGRRCLLGRQLGLIRRSAVQRSCFWFRLADFDRATLERIEALGPEPPAEGEPFHYDRYYSTHHFLGRGHWIWLIPLRAPDGSELMSVGFTWRPDVLQSEVRSMDDFLAVVDAGHPVVGELVRSGRAVDTNLYRNFRYDTDRAFSSNRWALLGDACGSFDPLFSNGLTFASLQIEQVAALITRDLAGDHDADYVDALDRAYRLPVAASQATIAGWFSHMHDPITSAILLNMIEVAYWYLLLPLAKNGCHHDPRGLTLWNILLLGGGRPTQVPERLLELRERVGSARPEHFVYPGQEKVNLRALELCADRRGLLEQFEEGRRVLDAYLEEVAARLQPLEAGACGASPA